MTGRLYTSSITNTELWHFVDFWTEIQEEVQLPAVAADVSLPDIVVSGLPSGASIKRALLIFAFGAKENTNDAANKISGTQYIKIAKGTGSYSEAIELADDIFALGGTTREGGGVIIGSIDLSGIVSGDDTYHVKWADALCDVPNINFNDVQVGLRIWFS